MDNLRIDSLGSKFWYNDEGQLHRENGPAVEHVCGSEYWCINGNLHRENGPAIICNYYKVWYINGKIHREDGPAFEYNTGKKVWYYNNRCIGGSWDGFTQEDFERYLKTKKY